MITDTKISWVLQQAGNQFCFNSGASGGLGHVNATIPFMAAVGLRLKKVVFGHETKSQFILGCKYVMKPFFYFS